MNEATALVASADLLGFGLVSDSAARAQLHVRMRPKVASFKGSLRLQPAYFKPVMPLPSLKSGLRKSSKMLSQMLNSTQ
jgi:hypothetical protein